MKDIIRLGDSTSRGGVVFEVFPQTDLNGKSIARSGYGRLSARSIRSD